MSFQAMAWAVDQTVKNSGQKLVLLMLASHCNGHTGQCNPSHARLAIECCMSVSALKNHLRLLAEQGFVTVIHKSIEGVALPNQYNINFDGVGQNLAGGGSESGYKTGIKTVNESGIKTGKPRQGAAPTFVVPEWINLQHWEAWHSTAKRRKATPAQKQLAVDKLAQWRDEGVDYALALQNAAVGGWQGLFKPDMPTTPTVGGSGFMGGMVGAGGRRLNSQETLEASNRAVAAEWVASHREENDE